MPGRLSLLSAVSRRDHAELGFEILGEVFGVVESDGVSDFGYGHLAFFQQLCRPLQADKPDEFHRRLSGQQ